MISDAMDKSRYKDGNSVEEAKGTELKVKPVDRYCSFDKVTFSYFVTNTEKMEVELDQP